MDRGAWQATVHGVARVGHNVATKWQEYWSGLPFPSPADLTDPGIEPRSPALQAYSLPTELQRKPLGGLLSRYSPISLFSIFTLGSNLQPSPFLPSHL